MPSPASETPRSPHAVRTPASAERQIELFSPRVRRSTVMYLRLRMLELREEGLERARAVIEHRLSVDALLADPPRPKQKATGPARRTVEP
ncbi:MAG: hypothetical protein ABSB70_00565 [Candidatus Velthaea sp.]